MFRFQNANHALTFVIHTRYIQWRIQGGEGGGMEDLCPPLPLLLDLFLFLQKRNLLSKISIKRVRNLSQNAGNGHFRDSNFQNFYGPRPIWKACAFGARWCPPPPFQNPGSAPDISTKLLKICSESQELLNVAEHNLIRPSPYPWTPLSNSVYDACASKHPNIVSIAQSLPYFSSYPTSESELFS